MKLVAVLTLLLVLAPLLARGAFAMPVTPQNLRANSFEDPLIRVQQDDIPEVVRLLAQRAVRAERRGDMATANALYAVIREMGYRVQRPNAQAPSGTGNNENRRRGNGGGVFGGGGEDRDNNDRDDDDDDDGGDNDDGDDGDDDDDD